MVVPTNAPVESLTVTVPPSIGDPAAAVPESVAVVAVGAGVLLVLLPPPPPQAVKYAATQKHAAVLKIIYFSMGLPCFGFVCVIDSNVFYM